MKSQYEHKSVQVEQQSDNDLDWRQETLSASQRELLRKDAAKVQFSRNLRRKNLDGSILGEPAWDILLTLFVIHNDRRRMNIRELAKATRIPLTTTVRWVAALEERNLARRRANPLDPRVVQVELTDEGRSSMESYFRLMREAEIFT